jgi:hypothetical protein
MPRHQRRGIPYRPSRRKQGKIYGKQESCKEVFGVEVLFYLKSKAFGDM